MSASPTLKSSVEPTKKEEKKKNKNQTNKQNTAKCKVTDFFTMFLFRSYMVLHLTYGFIIHLVLIIVKCVSSLSTQFFSRMCSLVPVPLDFIC